MGVVKADIKNIDDWVKLTHMLFPDENYGELKKTYMDYLNNIGKQREIGYLFQKDNKNVAFMNISIRNDYVNGCDTSPVVFIESIYVLPEYRKMGIARELIKTAEEFAKEKGILQIASDCLIDNIDSELFHKSCGFKETERVIYFVKNV